MLITANVASVAYEYDNSEQLPGPCDEYWQQAYRFDPRRVRVLTTVEALKAVDGYDYQACERDDYEGSEADRFVKALRKALVRTLPGFDEADTWEID